MVLYEEGQAQLQAALKEKDDMKEKLKEMDDDMKEKLKAATEENEAATKQLKEKLKAANAQLSSPLVQQRHPPAPKQEEMEALLGSEIQKRGYPNMPVRRSSY
eukprot:gene19730-26422_t